MLAMDLNCCCSALQVLSCHTLCLLYALAGSGLGWLTSCTLYPAATAAPNTALADESCVQRL
jgi:hypothetical protein